LKAEIPISRGHCLGDSLKVQLLSSSRNIHGLKLQLLSKVGPDPENVKNMVMSTKIIVENQKHQCCIQISFNITCIKDFVFAKACF